MDEILQQTPPQKGYGKRPLWQWIVIYIIIAAIIYGLIYYFVLAKHSGPNNFYQTGNPYPTTGQQVTSAPSPTSEYVSPTIKPSATPTATQHTVTLSANGYTPATLTIKAGETVTWVNNSGEEATVNSDPHPTHTNYPPLNLGSFANGGKLSLLFPTQGTYGYHNHLNPSEHGTIIVE